MTNTTNYNLKKPEDNDNVLIGDLNENADAIDQALHGLEEGKAAKAKPAKAGSLAALDKSGNLTDSGRTPGAAGGVATLDESGKVPEAQLPEMDYDPAGSAEKVQKALNSHASNKQNPHAVTAAQVGAYTKEQALKATTAALYGLTSSAVPDDVLSILSKAVVWKNTATTAQIGTLPVGTTVYFNENGTSVPYIIVNQGIPQNSLLYDSSCNGTWVLRQDIDSNKAWDVDTSNAVAGSDIMSVMAVMLNRYDADVQSAIKEVLIPYCEGGGSQAVKSGIYGLSCKIFPLGGYEVGFTSNDNSNIPKDGDVLSYFQGTSSIDSKRIAYLNGSATNWWLRSPSKTGSVSAFGVTSSGGYNSWRVNYTYGVRPAFILPSDFVVPIELPKISLCTIADTILLNLPGAQITTGSYVGTGTYGSSNPNSLTFGFVPKILVVGTSGGYWNIFIPGIDTGFYTTSDYDNVPSFYQNSIEWYNSSSATYQFNKSNSTYYYVAIG